MGRGNSGGVAAERRGVRALGAHGGARGGAAGRVAAARQTALAAAARRARASARRARSTARRRARAPGASHARQTLTPRRIHPMMVS